jgi:peptidoglycan/LPS O-acetylase OafA/YrhL
MYHVSPATLHIWTLFPLGSNGVTLFFTLSGFVICYNYYYKFSSSFFATIGNFYRARFARIYPVYFLVLAPFILFGFQPTSGYFGDFLPHLTMTQAWLFDKNKVLSFNPVAWSVSVEIFFYIAFPFIFLFLLKKLTSIKAIYLTGMVIYLALVGYVVILAVIPDPASGVEETISYLWAYIFPLPHLADFLLGCLAALIFDKLRNRPVTQKELARSSVLVALSIGFITFLMFEPFAPVFNLGNLNSLFFACLIFYLARYSTGLQKLLSTRALVFLGEVSYSFYLIHYFCISLTNQLIDYSKFPGVLAIFITLLISILFSALLYLFVEKPFKKLILGRKPPAAYDKPLVQSKPI